MEISELDTHTKFNMNMDARNSTKQCEFAKKLKEIYKTCVICNISIPVEGAHIIPYAVNEDFNINNGLLLCNNHHALFDKFLFSIDPESLIIELSNEMAKDKYHKMYNGMKLRIPKEINSIELCENIGYHYKKFLEKTKKSMNDK